MDTKNAVNQVIEAGSKMVEKGFAARPWGNVSCRIDDNHFVITSGGKAYDALGCEDVIKVRIDNLECEGNIKPISEKGIHASIYKNKPEVNFIIHTQQMNASAVSAVGIRSFRPGKRYELLGDHVVYAGYGLPGTTGLVKNVEKAIKTSTGNSIIMKKHGALSFGKDSKEAFQAAEQLEKACEGYIKDTYSTITGNWMFNPIQMGSYVIGKPVEYKGVLDMDDEYIVNDNPYVIACSNMDRPLFPFLDDFAQIVGPRMTVVENDKRRIKNALKKTAAVFVKGFGAVCRGSEKEVISRIVEKNCMAYLTAKMISSAARPLTGFESNLMRIAYIKKYSRQMA